jgi:hypothetical protein
LLITGKHLFTVIICSFFGSDGEKGKSSRMTKIRFICFATYRLIDDQTISDFSYPFRSWECGCLTYTNFWTCWSSIPARSASIPESALNNSRSP